ncbi:MAG TPA: hypothetical protein PLS36_07475 [Clostridia bacterium]|nr:hypothetical protein [Clostridia bacterium]HXK71064.1 hypothetical protein [Clostridia bacterium]
MSTKENKPTNSLIEKLNKSYLILGAVFLVAFITRVFIAGAVMGHLTDMGCFSYWGEQAYNDGLLEFYNGSYYCDYPPLYIYILWFIEFAREALGLTFAFPAHIILLKMPAIIFDIMTAYLVYKIAKTRFSETTSIILSAAVALNIAYILNSAAWGQIDSILTFFIALTAYNIMNNKLEFATVAYVIAVLLKPQAFIFAPILIFAYIKSKNTKKVLISLLIGLALFVVVILPFAIRQEPLWIFSLYFGTMGQYAYATVNAYNIYALLGLNWVSDSEVMFLFAYKIYGYVAILGICALTTIAFIKGNKMPGFTFATAGLLMTVVFAFATKMHERYLFPSILLVLAAYIFSNDKRFLYIHILQSITVFANCAYILYMNFNGGYDLFSPYVAIVSAVTIFTTLWYLRVYFQLYILNQDNIPLKYLT